ncbi:hypothetical protein NPIL_41861 [Nephila pilipes]|uniref:Uncharacterized protein n=1 Tax=Nephila pilipes TaxID=299642 RepID=A0A8X6NIX0_NEPPI|nr:hypothetical protein NPIL_41861 [Nephila pilipes]
MRLKVNADRYSESLRKMKTAIMNRRCGLLLKVVIMLQNNNLPQVTKTLHRSSLALQMGDSSYRPDLSPCSLQTSRSLKKSIEGRPFANYNKICESVEEWNQSM